MSEPRIARLLLSVATPAADWDSIVGDLCEEYAARMRIEGRKRADVWYWSQALRSIPALLTYSRQETSLAMRLRTGAIVLALLFVMIFTNDLLDQTVAALLPHGDAPLGVYLLIGWLTAAIFGLALATLVRYHPIRAAFFASTFLVLAFATPILLGLSGRLALADWILLAGAIPAMCVGAAGFQAFRKH